MVRGSPRATGNLPQEFTTLVGRRFESSEVRRLLARSRLTTLIGPGGVGKTRLALHVAQNTRAAFPDGVWLLALADVTQPDLLPSIALSTLGKLGPAGNGAVAVVDQLGDRQLLLVLDNCEHLTEACAKLATELLRGCPNVRVLATSREALRIDGETQYLVPPLSFPEPGVPQAGAAVRSDAVALFVDRAAAFNPEFVLRGEDEQAVVALCQRLDGLPLAIELAAAGTRLVPIAQLLSWANDPSLAPALGRRTAPSRHRTLRATMEYSYQLCSDHARTLWARMSVFRGGAELDAIEAVCGGEGLPRTQVRSPLAELVDKSIATFDGARYRTLETIRQFGEECLGGLGEEPAVRRAHRDRYAELATEVEAGWFGPDQPALLGRVAQDLANVRAALEFCVAEKGEAGVGLRMASALWPFWLGCGLPGEGRRWLDRLLAADEKPTGERVTALWVAGYLAAVDGDVPAGLALVDACRQLADRFHDEVGIARAAQKRGFCGLLEGGTAEAVADLESAVRLERKLGDDNPYLAEALLYLGSALCYEGSLDRAADVLEEARAITLGHGEQLFLSWILVHLGLVALLDQRVSDAAALVSDALTRKRALEDTLGITFAVEILGWTALASGDAERSARLLAASETMSTSLGGYLAGNKQMLEWHRQYVRQARELLGRRAFEAATDYGRGLAADQVIDYALGETTAAKDATPNPWGDLPLTPREREIAQLVAAGKTNKDIAADLVIAHRTVDTHVENILTKMGFTSRTQIAALLSALPLP